MCGLGLWPCAVVVGGGSTGRTGNSSLDSDFDQNDELKNLDHWLRSLVAIINILPAERKRISLHLSLYFGFLCTLTAAQYF